MTQSQKEKLYRHVKFIIPVNYKRTVYIVFIRRVRQEPDTVITKQNKKQKLETTE